MRGDSASQAENGDGKRKVPVWRSVRFSCEPGFEDVIVSGIFESGFSGLEEHPEDNRIFFTAYYTFSPNTPDPLELFMNKIKETPVSKGEPRLEILSVEDVPDEDWETKWRNGLKPIEIGKRLLVKPSWTTYKNTENRLEIIIDPKMAFGTGDHSTTRLCLEVLEAYGVEGLTVLDAGFGSGILSIAAVKLGAQSVFGFDKDPFSVENARENIRLNGVWKHITLVEADLETVDAEPADIVLANMISGALIPNLALFHGFLKPGGKVVFSGLLADEEGIFTEELEKVEDFFRAMKQELGIEKIMVRTLRRINKLIEIAMLAYTIAFKILMIGGKLVSSIIEMGGRMGLKSKKEDSIGRILKGLANIVLLL